MDNRARSARAWSVLPASCNFQYRSFAAAASSASLHYKSYSTDEAYLSLLVSSWGGPLTAVAFTGPFLTWFGFSVETTGFFEDSASSSSDSSSDSSSSEDSSESPSPFGSRRYKVRNIGEGTCTSHLSGVDDSTSGSSPFGPSGARFREKCFPPSKCKHHLNKEEATYHLVLVCPCISLLPWRELDAEIREPESWFRRLCESKRVGPAKSGGFDWLRRSFSRWKISSPFLFHCLKDHRHTSLVPDAKAWKNSSFRSCKLTSSASIRTMSIRYRACLFWTSSAMSEFTLHIHSTVWSEIYYLSLQWTLEGKRRGYQSGAILMPAVLFWMNSGGINAAIHLSNFWRPIHFLFLV